MTDKRDDVYASDAPGHVLPGKTFEEGDDGLAETDELSKEASLFINKEYNRLRLKFSLVIIPLMCFIYGLAFADKLSLSYGVVFSLKEDTGLVGKEYANLTVWFYLAYLCGQGPMLYLIQRYGLGKGLGLTATFWGISLLGIGASRNYADLSICRVFLGWFECPITTGFILLVSSWYTRTEITMVTALFLSMNQLGGGIWSLMLYALARHSVNSGGIAGWRLMNYFLGGVTTFFGLLSLIFLNTPDKVWWLTKEEKRIAKARTLKETSGGADTHAWEWKQVWECLRDPVFYLILVFNFTSNVANGVVTTFGTLVTRSFGFTALESILYQQPANGIGFVWTLILAYLSAKYPRSRFPLVVGATLSGMIVYLYIGLAPDAPKWQRFWAYTFRIIANSADYVIWPLISVNVTGRTKKSFMGMAQMGAYCIGNMVGAVAVPDSDAPKYTKSLVMCAVVYVIKSAVCIIWWGYYIWQNRIRDREQVSAGISDADREKANTIAVESDKTDKENRHFRYHA